MDTLKDAHYFPLPSQGSIYTFTNIKLANNTNKLLVASLKREVYCFEYQEDSSGVLKPTLKEISFTYIPSAAEIISMDVFNKSESSNDFVIGITIIKNGVDSGSLETYLNIYSEWEESEEFSLESIAQNCLNVELNFIPYHLNHTLLVTWQNGEIANKEVVFLLSGSDSLIHVYRESKTNHNYKESDCKEYFPEFNKLPSIPMWFDVLYDHNYTERLTAIGCECGYLRLSKVDVKTNKLLFLLSSKFVSSIISVRFQLENTYKLSNALSSIVPRKTGDLRTDAPINLIVLNSILPGVYFKDVKNYGLQKYCSLKRSEATCVSSCMEIVDLDFDGKDEILVGNSAKELLHYKSDANLGWNLMETKKVVSPILGIKYVDLTGDGVKELVVFTMKGVYVFQHDMSVVQEKLLEKFELIKSDS